MTRLVPVRVLVIDDDDGVCRRVAGWLAEAAYDVVTFTSPAEGLEHLRQAPAHVALVDLRLPDADGVKLVQALRQISPKTLTLAMVAFPEVAHITGALRSGVRDVLEKPVQQAALHAALERVLREAGICVRSEAEFNRRLGARLRVARTAANLTLSDVARACGLSSAQLSHIELGKTATSTWTLARISAALRTPLPELFSEF